jgi:hypothetical protein
MRVALVAVLFVVSAIAQDQSAVSAAQSACGPVATEFRTKSIAASTPLPNLLLVKRRCMSSWIRNFRLSGR